MDNGVIHSATEHFNWELLAVRCYALISALLLLKVLTGIAVIIYKAIREGRKSEGYYLITNASKSNSSFFNLIFLNHNQVDNFEKEQILAHELQHVRQWHSADQLFTELLKAFFWVNPFMYLIAKELKQVHEFQVDQCLAGTYKANNYANLLLKLMSHPTSRLVNEFSAYGVKTRIRMLFHEQSQAKYKLRYFWLVPILIIIGYQFSLEKTYAQTPLKDNFTLILDAGHGGDDGGAVCGGKYFEKNINLALALEIKVVAEKRGIRTLLTRKTDEHVEFKDRVAYQGDVFASLHINAAPAGPLQQDANGIEIKDNPSGQNSTLSAQFAGQLKSSFRQLGGINTNDTIFAAPGLYVLRENKIPAVLIEFGYGTNPKDLNYILEEQHRYAIAEKFVDAVIAYKNERKN
ncbi:N-acetylmuramoyl-L-alanine amidase [Mucilaginibacter lappiensis]|uniref:N-acetylmuramoyl-L-alanine amidase n=1 Tax=Mucilaginibacter lappiensis TaxID=354630 RepID=UPI003D2498CE